MLTKIRHPLYNIQDLYQYRLCYEGGRQYIECKLEKYSDLESKTDFERRKRTTYCPAFAKEALNELRDTVASKLNAVVRRDVPPSFTACMEGLDGGVDFKYTSMNNFMGLNTLTELMVCGRVGVYVDMPAFNPNITLADITGRVRPYLYIYPAENILSWTYNNDHILTAVLLQEDYPIKQQGLFAGYSTRYRHMYITLDGVKMDIWEVHVENDEEKEVLVGEIMLGIKRIPLVISELNTSLLHDIHDYQNALLNIESTDVSFIREGNYSMYVEPYDPRSGGSYKKTKIQADGTVVEEDEVISVGNGRGKRYPMGANSPEFIGPNADLLKASMEKGKNIKEDIRRLMKLAIADLARTSSDRMKVENKGVESGLAALGSKLQEIENQVLEIWAQYEKSTFKGKVIYPQDYDNLTEEARFELAKSLTVLKTVVPSRTFNKEVSKRMAEILLGQSVTSDILTTIKEEIDTARFITSDAKEIEIDVANGLVSAVTASTARGYEGPSEVPVAQAEHAERLKRINDAQSKPQGVKDNNE